MAIVAESKIPVSPNAPEWTRFTVDFTDFQPNAGPTKTITLTTFPPKTAVTGVLVKHGASFSGGSTSAATLSVGGTVVLGRWADAFNVFQAPADNLIKKDTSFSGSTEDALHMEDAGSSKDVTITLTITGDIIDNITSGNAEIWFLTALVP